jgi:hypothetical protein
MNVAGRTIGVIAVQHYRDEHAYGEEEKQVLTFVAEQTALAIERKQADQALRTRTEQIRRHRNVLLELAQFDKSDFDRTLLEICRQSAATLGVARVGYWSLAEDELALTCDLLYLSEQNEAAPEARGTRLRSSECPSYFKVLSEKQPIVADDARTCPATREMRTSYLEPLGIASMLDAPVWVHGKVVGCLPRAHRPSAGVDAGGGRPGVITGDDGIDRHRSGPARAVGESPARIGTKVSRSLRGFQPGRHDPRRKEDSRSQPGHASHHGLQPVRRDSRQASGGYVSSHSTGWREVHRGGWAVHCGMYDAGSARFDWVSHKADGGTVPLEVILTRVEMGDGSLSRQSLMISANARRWKPNC